MSKKLWNSAYNEYSPTIESGKIHLDEEQSIIYQRIAELTILIKEKEEKFNEIALKINNGIFTKTLEKVLEKYGGSRKAFFQSYSGAHLIAMGNNIDKIIEDLPPEISLDERIITTFQAIKLFFEAKEAMKNHLDMTDAEINLMKYKIKAFATFMKTNLGSLKPKQKGHLMLFELPEFVSIFKTASFFSDNAIESCHPIHNSQERRIKCKQDPTRYSLLLKWAIDNNYYFDNIDCKSYEEK